MKPVSSAANMALLDAAASLARGRSSPRADALPPAERRAAALRLLESSVDADMSWSGSAEDRLMEAFQHGALQVARTRRGAGSGAQQSLLLSEFSAAFECLLEGVLWTSCDEDGQKAHVASGPAGCQIAASTQGQVGKAGAGGANHSGPDRFLRKLSALLRQLPRESRRGFMEKQLTQGQRLALERWLLREAQGGTNGSSCRKRRSSSACKRRPNGSTSLASCECHATVPAGRGQGAGIWRNGASGYVANVHLGLGLYVQSASCRTLAAAISGLGLLLQLRVRCWDPAHYLGAGPGQRTRAFEQGVATAVAAFGQQGMTAGGATACPVPESTIDADVDDTCTKGCIGSSGGPPRLLFRTMVPFGGSLRFDTPLRQDVRRALSDWRCLSDSLVVADGTRKRVAHQGPVHAEPGALAPRMHGLGRSPGRGIDPAAAEASWSGASEAWLALWSEHGKPVSQLHERLHQMEARWRRVQQRTERHWKRSQARIGHELEQLLRRGVRNTTPKLQRAAKHKRRSWQVRLGNAGSRARTMAQPASRQGSTPKSRTAIKLSEELKGPQQPQQQEPRHQQLKQQEYLLLHNDRIALHGA